MPTRIPQISRYDAERVKTGRRASKSEEQTERSIAISFLKIRGRILKGRASFGFFQELFFFKELSKLL
ncbi:MAG: hypothetical protein ACK5QX_01825 [bacterium]